MSSFAIPNRLLRVCGIAPQGRPRAYALAYLRRNHQTDDMVENVDAGRPRTFPALTGLRFFAATAVLMFHFGAGFSDRAGAVRPISNLLHNGYLGVSLFFVLSGFILTYTYQGKTLSARFIADFTVARLARIYPVYLAALVLALPVLAVPLSVAKAVAVLVMLQSWTNPSSSSGYTWVMQAWTLSVEVFFYALFPFVLIGVRRLSGAACAVLAGVVSVAIVLMGLSSVTPGTPVVWPIPVGWTPILPALRFAEFLYGALTCAFMLKSAKLGPRFSGLAPTLLCAGMIVLILSSTHSASIKAVATVLFGLLMLQLAEGDNLVVAFLGSRPLLFLGGASYALYLLQGPVRAICSHYVRHPLDQLVSPLMTLGLAAAVFVVWEQPSRRWILFFYKQVSGRMHGVKAEEASLGATSATKPSA